MLVESCGGDETEEGVDDDGDAFVAVLIDFVVVVVVVVVTR